MIKKFEVEHFFMRWVLSKSTKPGIDINYEKFRF